MGTVFQTLNESARAPGVLRGRYWLEPGCPRVLLSGLLACLSVDRVDGEYRPRLRVTEAPGRTAVMPFRGSFWVIARAARLDASLRPVGILVEVTTIESASMQGTPA